MKSSYKLLGDNEIFVDKQFNNLKISKIRSRKNLTFINCKISSLILENCKNHSTAIQFENCEIDKLLYKKSTHIHRLIFSNCKIKICTVENHLYGLEFYDTKCGSVCINNSSISKINLHNCIVNFLRGYNSAMFCIIVNTTIDDVSISHGDFALDQCENSKFLSTRFTKCTFGKLHSIDFGYLYIDDVSSLLKAKWYNLSDNLTKLCMAYDAQNNPYPNRFDKWATTSYGICPYTNLTIGREIEFKEQRRLWSPKLKNIRVSGFKILQKLFKEKGIKAKWRTSGNNNEI